ncbi:hypothetical protein Tco_0480661 [Tanacetum coccineum]
MDTTRAQQQALDDELVAPADRLKIGKSNLRLSSTLKSKEPTLQVVVDVLKLTPFYNAFEISADVPEIYMQEFWVTISRHHSSLHFKLNGKSHTVNVDNFRDILKICPKLADLTFQVENKNSKKNNDMYYPRFTKAIVDYFMAKDQAIPKRNKMFWHHARDDFMFTTIRVISKHQDTQVYGAILPQHLTNQAMLESEAYMTYRAYASGEKTPKPKTTKKKVESEAFPKTKTTQATEGKRIKSSAKGDKAAKKKQPAETSMDKCADEGTGDIPGVPDVPTYGSDDEQISWKSSEEDDEDEVNVSENDDDNDNNDDDDDVDNQDEENQDDDDDEQTDSDNDGDDFVHPNDEDVQGTNTEEEKMIEEATHEEDEVNELYRDVNINLEGRDIMMIDAPLPNVQATQETEDTHVILTAPINPEGQRQSSSVSSGFVSNMLNPRPDTSIDSIFNTKETSMVDVPVITIAEPPLVFATTLPPPPTPLITHMFDHRLKTLEIDFSEFKQTNQFAEAVSSIHGIVDAYLANKMQKAVKTSIQL